MNDRFSKVIKSPLLIPLGASIVSFGIGGVTGYILGRKKNQPQLHQQKPRLCGYDIPEQMAFDYDGMEKWISEQEELAGIAQPKLDTVVTIAETEQEANPFIKVGDFIEQKIGERMPTMAPDPAVITRSIFAANNDDWNYDSELEHRSENAPFVIHRDEFYGDEEDYTQCTVTYYASDNILVDEDDTPIYNHDSIIGPLLFGHGSGDQNIFYVRNDKRNTEYEVVHDPGFYSVEVLGLDVDDVKSNELKHSSGLRKFRDDD